MLKPDFFVAHYNLGSALGHEGQYDAAIAEDREAIRLKPDLAEAHNNLGLALAAKGQYGAAIAEFKEAIWLKAQPHQGPLQLGRGSQKVR